MSHEVDKKNNVILNNYWKVYGFSDVLKALENFDFSNLRNRRYDDIDLEVKETDVSGKPA